MDLEIAETRFMKALKPHGQMALGCWAFGGDAWGAQDDTDSRNVLAAALEQGFSHWDTAAGYGRGHSEELVGQTLKGRRDKVFLATKVFPYNEDKLIKQVEASFGRLDVDVIDLLYIHWPLKDGQDMRPLWEKLEGYRQQGRVRFLGVSNFSVENMDAMREVGEVDVHQLGYNLCWRGPEQRGVVTNCREHGTALCSYSSLAQGILFGKFTSLPKFEENDHRSGVLLFREELWPHIQKAVDEWKEIAAEAGISLAQLAMQWLLVNQRMDLAIVGARNVEQLKANAQLMSGDPLSAELLDCVTAISDDLLQHIPEENNIFGFSRD